MLDSTIHEERCADTSNAGPSEAALLPPTSQYYFSGFFFLHWGCHAIGGVPGVRVHSSRLCSTM